MVNTYEGTHDIHALILGRAQTGIAAFANWSPDADGTRRGQQPTSLGTTMKLYNHYRSSAAYRVRIALNLKGLTWQHVGVHLLKAQHRAPDYLKLNPAGLVPTLVADDGAVLTQSLAIMEYLDDAGLGDTAVAEKTRWIVRMCERWRWRWFATHPLNNVRVLNYPER